MRVFKHWGVTEPFARFDTARKHQALWGDEFQGESKAASWTPIDLHPQEEEHGKPEPMGPIADVTTVNAIISNCVWGPRARAVLEPHVARCGEFLPLRCKEAEWVLFNVTRKIDVLDLERSKITYFKSSGNVMDFVEMIFNPEALRDELLFRIPQRGGNDVFVTDAFAALVEQHGLTGFNLKLVWDSESQDGKTA
jgi:hypothetical protein